MAYFAIGPVASGVLTARQIVRAGLLTDIAIPTGQHGVDVTAAVGDVPQSFVGRRFGSTDGTVREAEDTTAADQKERLHAAAQRGFAGILPHWRRLAGGDDNPSEATFRWIVHTVAAADLIVDGAFRASGGDAITRTAEQIEAVVRHVEDVMGGRVADWYEVMIDNPVRAGQWAGSTGLADGSLIYTDAITSAGAPRTIDGEYLPLSGNGLPAGFDTESRTLR